MPLAQVSTPPFVYEMISKFTISKFDFIPKEDFYVSNFNTSQCYTPFMENFADSNYPSVNFFYNQGDLFILLLIILLYFIGALILHLIFGRKTDYFYLKLVEYRYNVFLRLVIEEYLPVMVSALMTVKRVCHFVMILNSSTIQMISKCTHSLQHPLFW